MDDKKRYAGVKAFGIARVSDPKQIEALPAQRRKLNDYSRSLGLDMEYFEFNESAYSGDREKFLAIINKILSHKEFYVILFDKIDRLVVLPPDAVCGERAGQQCLRRRAGPDQYLRLLRERFRCGVLQDRQVLQHLPGRTP